MRRRRWPGSVRRCASQPNHYGLLASTQREQNIARARQLLEVPAPQPLPAAAVEPAQPADATLSPQPCPCCGGRMIVIEAFLRGRSPRYRPTAPLRIIRIDTS